MLPAFDLILVIVSLAIFGFIGFYCRPDRGANTVDYFLAQRQMAVIPAAFSISVSFFSSSALTIYQGEVVMFGNPLYVTILSALIAGIVTVYFVLHRLYNSPHLSVFLFLEDRFSRHVRIINSMIFVVAGLITIAVTGYTLAISAEVLAEVPFWVSTVIAGLLSTAYSTLGGIRAVIWTDVCQAVLMILFPVLICIKGLLTFDSFDQFTKLVAIGERAKFRFHESPDERYSLQSDMFFFVVHFLYMECVSQPGVQRWRSVKSLKDAKKTVIISLLFNTLFLYFIFAGGLVLFAFYSRCDTPDGRHPTSDKISLYFVQKELSSWPGARGMCLVGLLSGALSTMSSFLNSLAAVTLEDCVKIRFPNLDEKLELTISKGLTAIYGIVSTVLIFATSRSPGMVIVHITALAISMAPPLGTFLLGLWTKRANSLGASLGMGVGVILVAWLSIGSALHGNRHQPLPSPKCPGNTTSLVQMVQKEILDRIPPTDSFAEKGILDHIYGMSFYWYSTISLLASFIFGYLFSFCVSGFHKGCHHSDDTVCDEPKKPSELSDFCSGHLKRPAPSCKDLETMEVGS